MYMMDPKSVRKHNTHSPKTVSLESPQRDQVRVTEHKQPGEGVFEQDLQRINLTWGY